MKPREIRNFLAHKKGKAPVFLGDSLILGNINSEKINSDTQDNFLFKDDKRRYNKDMYEFIDNYSLGLKNPTSNFSIFIMPYFVLDDNMIENEPTIIKELREQDPAETLLESDSTKIKKAAKKLHVDLFREAKDRILNQFSISDAADIIVYNRNRKSKSVIGDVNKARVKKWLEIIKNKDFKDAQNVTQIKKNLKVSNNLQYPASNKTIKSMIDIAFSDKEIMNKYIEFGIKHFDNLSDLQKTAFAKIMSGPSIHDMVKYSIFKHPKILEQATLNNC